MQKFKERMIATGKYKGTVRQCRERNCPNANAYGKFAPATQKGSATKEKKSR
jgi:hypothetical protein